MDRTELLTHLRSHKWAVACTVSAEGAPESALVGIAVTDNFELVFDTSKDSRKVANLRRHRGISFVVGGWSAGDERTIQYEGYADLPQGQELEQLKEAYFAAFPEGRKRAREPQTVYVRAMPRWARYSNFNDTPPSIQEFTFAVGASGSEHGVR